MFLLEIVFSNDANHSETETTYGHVQKKRLVTRYSGDQYLRMFSEHGWMKCPLDHKRHQATKIIGSILYNYLIFEEFQQRLHRSFPV